MDDNSDWIYDSVVGFLNSPIWSVPIESFIDNNCLVFEENIEENATHRTLHSQYRGLVEELLESFTKDIGITPRQFIEGCQKVKSARGSHTQGMFEYVFASVNFELFKRIMIRHNAALSLQALQMLHQQGKSLQGSTNLEEEVLKFSEKEFKQRQENFARQTEKEIADLEASLLKSRIDCETIMKDIEKDKETMLSTGPTPTGVSADSALSNIITQTVEESRAIARVSPAASSKLPQAPSSKASPAQTPPESAATSQVPPHIESSPTSSPAPATPTLSPAKPTNNVNNPGILPPISKNKNSVNSNAAQQWLDNARIEMSSNPSTQVQESKAADESLEERKRYWLQRKQSLLQQKKTQNLDALTQHASQDIARRPTSARVARAVTERPAQPPLEDTPNPTISEDRVPAMSAALASALKREVIYK